MGDETIAPATHAGAQAGGRDLDGAQARLAYSIIESLLEHTRVTSDLVALMAQALSSDVLEALTVTPHWTAYLDSRRTLERTRQEIEQFTEIMNALGSDADKVP